MDFDGLMLLAKGERERYEEWKKNSQSLSLEKLGESYNEWLARYRESYQKYWDLEAEDKLKDVMLQLAKMLYLHELANYTLNVLAVYTARLREEYNSLKKIKAKPSGKRAKTKRKV